MSIKADKTYVDDLNENVTAQLAQTEKELKNIYYQAPPPNGVDDSDMVNEVLNYCVEKGYRAYFLPGTYVVDPNKVVVRLKENESLYMYGSGRSTVFKRKDMSTTINWKVLFDIRSHSENTEDVDTVRIESVFIDSNARNQQEPAMDNKFEFQHSADFNIRGTENSRIKNVFFENVYFDDGVADHIYFPGVNDSFVDSLRINNMEVASRNRVRSDITITGTIQDVMISNFNGQKIETEINVKEGPKAILFIRDSIMNQALDLGGQMQNIDVTVDNVRSLRSTHLWNVDGTITNSTLVMSEGQRFSYLKTRFKNVVFLYKPTNGNVDEIRLYAWEEEGYYEFDSCRFIIDTEDDVVAPNAIYGAPLPSKYGEYTNNTSKIVVKDCYFDERFEVSVYANRCGKVELIDNDYAGTKRAIDLYGNLDYTIQAVIKGGQYDRCSGFLYFYAAGGVDLQLESIVQRYENSLVTSNSTTLHSLRTVTLNNRKIYTDIDPTTFESIGSIAGDVYELLSIPNSGEIYKWKALNSHSSSTTNIQPLAKVP